MKTNQSIIFFYKKFIQTLRSVYLQQLFVAHLKIDEILAENMKLQAQLQPKEKESKIKPNFYNTFSHFPKFKETSINQSFGKNLKKPVFSKDTESLTLHNKEKTEKVEEDFKKNSEEIEKLKQELR